MKINLSKYRCAQVACLSLWPILLCAQSSDLAQNIGDCQDGFGACERSKLTPSELMGVDIALRRRNLSDCKSGWTCDRSRLTSSETIEVNAAEHQRNVQNCENSWADCDHSKLTESEAARIAVAEHQRNISACKGSSNLRLLATHSSGGQDAYGC